MASTSGNISKFEALAEVSAENLTSVLKLKSNNTIRGVTQTVSHVTMNGSLQLTFDLLRYIVVMNPVLIFWIELIDLSWFFSCCWVFIADVTGKRFWTLTYYILISNVHLWCTFCLTVFNYHMESDDALSHYLFNITACCHVTDHLSNFYLLNILTRWFLFFYLREIIFFFFFWKTVVITESFTNATSFRKKTKQKHALISEVE